MTSAATATAIELLHAQPETSRAQQALDALAGAAARAGARVRVTTRYAGAAPWLLLWGPGAPDRIEAIRSHVAAGGRVIALDLAYWSRTVKARLSFDGPHPQAFVMQTDRSPARWQADPAPIANRWDPAGPVVVAGLGRKARVQYGAATLAWEAEMIRLVQCDGRTVLYRRKTADAAFPEVARGSLVPDNRTIEQVLAGASLLLTWHSNVAVDAIRLGIPVVCVDGAAAAVCPSTLSPGIPEPLDEGLRARFLQNLAWFQWAPATEGSACWRFISQVLA